MRKIVKRVVSYRCGVCKTAHASAAKARACESMPVEKKKFKKGDLVRNIEPRTCSINRRPYHFRARITQIVGPSPFDFEYEVKWLGGRGLNQHVFQYEVVYICPHCGVEFSGLYYAPELKKAGHRTQSGE